MSYEVLKNRLTNGKPFTVEAAMDRITALADSLDITQEQAEELTNLAQTHGLDAMPEDLATRVDTLEEALNMILEGVTE